MIPKGPIPEIADSESVARYAFSSGHIRKIDGTLKQNAFMPPPNFDFSTTRHLDTSEAELWSIGKYIASGLNKPLLGRGDFSIAVAKALGLIAGATPNDWNRNHASLTGWPTDKEKQKLIAQELAAAAALVPAIKPDFIEDLSVESEFAPILLAASPGSKRAQQPYNRYLYLVAWAFVGLLVLAVFVVFCR